MTKQECREQIQEDIISYFEGITPAMFHDEETKTINNLCQIVVDNFKKLEN